jgi:hypothetical protein
MVGGTEPFQADEIIVRPGGATLGFSGPGTSCTPCTSGRHKGQCNTSPNAPELAKGAVASFLLSAVLRKA